MPVEIFFTILFSLIGTWVMQLWLIRECYTGPTELKVLLVLAVSFGMGWVGYTLSNGMGWIWYTFSK